ncbi:MAG: class I SAM-dependent methyltransferase [Vicinamibacterales bacterium]
MTAHGSRAPSDSPLDYWNTVGPGKDFAHPIDIERFSRWVPKDARVLDYGCGYGRGVSALHSHGYTQVAGVDPASGMIAAARERHPDLDFQLLEHPPHVPAAGGAFDAALLVAVLTCVPSDSSQIGLVGELNRVVRSGGVLHIADFWLQGDRRNLERYERTRPPGAPYGTFTLPEGIVLRHHSRAWIDQLTESYELLSLDEVTVRTMNGHEARGFHWYGRRP